MASLYAKFRLKRNSLSVSDLVAPSWCEVQFDYSLRSGRDLPARQRPPEFTSRTGKTITMRKEVAVEKEKLLKKGSAVHKKLEREIRPVEAEVTTTTPEDRWGLKLLKMLSSVRILIDEGRCREMPVMGFVHGQFVSGIIDELTRTPIAPSSLSNSFSRIHVIDNKTRSLRSMPNDADTLPSQLQLMLYKRLLDPLLQPSTPTPVPSSYSLEGLSFPKVWDHISVDPATHFSAQFLEESAVLVLDNNLGQETLQARCLRDLERIWQAIVLELGTGAGDGKDEDRNIVSKTLQLVYRLRGGKQAGGPKNPPAKTSGSDEGIIGTFEFEYDEAFLDSYLRYVLDFWHDRRPPRGVEVENVRRCFRDCEFVDQCEWLEGLGSKIT
ncbi:hypothetical protein BDV93DRAFT_525147 [Ceratobasidium sp. AG-I]|nr:hypothetical protein BDV93DRAFT_525147 [Ceratobasidium sp. AG-I]